MPRDARNSAVDFEGLHCYAFTHITSPSPSLHCPPPRPQPSGAVAATADGITFTIGAAGDCTTTPPVAAGDSVYLEYVARATDPSTGEQQIFDATRTKFRPAMRFQVDNDTSVIPGMHQGVVGMCAGEKRNLVIPSRLAYAGDGAGSMIKPHGEGRERGRVVCAVCVCACV